MPEAITGASLAKTKLIASGQTLTVFVARSRYIAPRLYCPKECYEGGNWKLCILANPTPPVLDLFADGRPDQLTFQKAGHQAVKN